MLHAPRRDPQLVVSDQPRPSAGRHRARLGHPPEIGETVGITERAAHRIVDELATAGYVSRERTGRRNHYTIQSDLPLPDPLARSQRVGDLLAILVGQNSSGTATQHAG